MFPTPRSFGHPLCEHSMSSRKQKTTTLLLTILERKRRVAYPLRPVPHPLVAQPLLAVLLGSVPPQGPLIFRIPKCSAGLSSQPSWVFPPQGVGALAPTFPLSLVIPPALSEAEGSGARLCVPCVLYRDSPIFSSARYLGASGSVVEGPWQHAMSYLIQWDPTSTQGPLFSAP
jgi:hypothetical protein